jgi:hypothetical protein
VKWARGGKYPVRAHLRQPGFTGKGAKHVNEKTKTNYGI